jgi:hemerythrin-like domain-containing protein
MKPTEILVNEHHQILQALDIFQNVQIELESGINPDHLRIETATDFFRLFADRFHHFKEEYLMFGILAQKKEGTYDFEIGMLRFQHERCRHHLEVIRNTLPGFIQKDEVAVTTLLESLSAYTALLKRHIHQEDSVFFPMIEKSLTQKEKSGLITYFENEERQFRQNKEFESCLSRMALIQHSKDPSI